MNRLSIGALFPRFVEAERTHGSLLRAFRAARRPASADGAFRSLPGGLSQLIDALTARLPADAVRLNTGVRRLSRGDPSQPYTIETDAGARITSRAVILATPAYVTGAIVGEVDVELARLCGEIAYASTATIVLAFHRADIAHALNGSGFVVPRAEHSGILAGFVAVVEVAAPGACRHGAASHVRGRRSRSARAWIVPTKSSCGGRSRRSRRCLASAAIRILTRVYRWERSTAQHEVGHAARMRGDRSRPGAAAAVCSSLAVDFAESASPTVSPTVGRRPGRWRTIWRNTTSVTTARL